MLHGGGSRGVRTPVSPTQLSVLRMVPTAQVLARSSPHLAVYRLLNGYRGWDADQTPVADCHWALDQLVGRHPDAPVGLVGHSLGGRAALLAAGHAAVRAVVALNPWLHASDDVDLRGRRVLFVHGDRDATASLAKAEAVARRLARRTPVGFVRVPGGTHAMLRGGFDRYAATFTAAVLLGRPVPAGPVARVLAGDQWVTA